MKIKKIVFLTFLFLANLTTSAQNICNGTVIDKDGNPVAQAKVEVVGTETSSLTDLDGAFSIAMPTSANMLKVEYLGMTSKTVKATPNMTIILNKAKRFSGSVYDEYQTIFGLQGMASLSSGVTPAMGYTIGRVKELGWYAKGIWGLSQDFTGTAVVGGMVRLGCPVYMYLGGGVVLDNHGITPAIDAGLMLRMKETFINAGIINGTYLNVGFGCFL